MPKPVTNAFATLALLTPAAPVLAEDGTWSGFYGGANVGLATGKSTWSGTNSYQTVEGDPGSSNSGDTFSFGTQTDPIQQRRSTSGLGGGARLGFNHQLGSFVLGAEADATMLDLDSIVSATGPAASYQLRSHASHLETVRARAGIAFGPALLFATGGLAFSNLRHRVTAADQSQVVVGTDVALVTNNLSATASSRSGWTVGAGGEVRITDRLSAALTVLHVDLGSTDLADTDGPASIAVRARSRLLVGTLGINFHF